MSLYWVLTTGYIHVTGQKRKLMMSCTAYTNPAIPINWIKWFAIFLLCSSLPDRSEKICIFFLSCSVIFSTEGKWAWDCRYLAYARSRNWKEHWNDNLEKYTIGGKLSNVFPSAVFILIWCSNTVAFKAVEAQHCYRVFLLRSKNLFCSLHLIFWGQTDSRHYSSKILQFLHFVE